MPSTSRWACGNVPMAAFNAWHFFSGSLISAVSKRLSYTSNVIKGLGSFRKYCFKQLVTA